MDDKQIFGIWQLGVGAGIMFGFGSNALEFFVPDLALRAQIKAALIIISGLLMLAGYSRVRKIVNREAEKRELDLPTESQLG